MGGQVRKEQELRGSALSRCEENGEPVRSVSRFISIDYQVAHPESIKRKDMLMKKIPVLLFILGLLLTSALQAGEELKKVSDFSLEDYNGVKHSLSEYASSKAIVIMFMATQCPVSNAYNERMAALQKDYAEKGVAFIGINANKQEGVEEIKNHAKEHGFAFPILKDWNNVVADKLGASVTPETYVLNSKFEVLYHGRIDDSQRENKVTSKDLRTALDSVLSGKPVANRETKAFGCSIKRVQ
jgi:thiol-disulfide isomerase/thioredoxin